MPTLTITHETGITMSVTVDRWDGHATHGRWVYRFTIGATDGTILAEGDELRSGTVSRDAAPDLPDALASLCAFAADGTCWSGTESVALEDVGGDTFAMLAEYLGRE